MPHPFTQTRGFASLQDRLKRYPVGEPLTGFVGLEHLVMNKDGLMISFDVQRPAAGTAARGVVVLAHGLNEHKGRYAHVARALTAAGFVVYLVDHQGHGRSEGRRLFVHHFHDFAEDVLMFVRLAKKQNPELASSVFMMGHSLGGAVAIDAVLTAPDEFRGAVFSAPASEVPPNVSRPLFLVLKLLSRIAPHAKLAGLDVTTLCRDEGVLTAYGNDPLIQRGKLPTRIIAELLAFADTIPARAAEIKLPYLLIQGSADRIVPPESSDHLHSKTSSADKTYVRVEGGYHELMNEDPAALDAVVAWLVAHAGGKGV